MSRLLSPALRAVASPFRLVVRHPVVSVCVLLLLVGVGLGGVAWYTYDQWHKAEVATREDRLPEARERIAFCLKVWPNSQKVHLLAARIDRRSGDLKAAETHLNRCLELNGGATDAVQVEFLLLRVQGGEVDELAPLLFELVEQGHPDAAEILDTVAKSYMVRLRYKLAYACLSRWIDLEPANAKPLYWRGWVLEKLGNEKSAKADYHKAIDLDPQFVLARLRIAEMLLEDKQAPEALPHLERLVKQVPDDPQVQARMGICRFLLGDHGEARRLMEGAVLHLPTDPGLLVTLANLEIQEGKGAAAEKWLRMVLASDPSDTEALFVLAAALRLQEGRADEAAAVMADYTRKREIVDRINDLLKEKADDPKATAADYAEIGTLFTEISRDKLAVYWLEKALEKDPQCQVAHRTLAEQYEKKGNAAAAAVHRRQVRTPDPPPGEKPSK